MPEYEALYPAGTRIRVASRDSLERFRKDWKYHHPLEPLQLEWADREAVVSSVGYYHGGDVLYEIEGLPGIWHEPCLTGAR